MIHFSQFQTTWGLPRPKIKLNGLNGCSFKCDLVQALKYLFNISFQTTTLVFLSSSISVSFCDRSSCVSLYNTVSTDSLLLCYNAVLPVPDDGVPVVCTLLV